MLIGPAISPCSVLMQSGGAASWISLLPGYSFELRLALDQGGPYDLESGDIVQWHDSSGFGNHATQSVPEERPTPETAGFNGRRSVRFQASTSDHLNANGFGAVGAGDDAPWTVAMLIEVISGTGAAFAFSSTTDADTIHTVQTPHVGGGGKLRSFRRGDATVPSSDVSSASNYPLTAQALIYEFTGTVGTIYIDDPDTPFSTHDMAAASVGQLTANAFTIAGQKAAGTLSRPLDCRIACVLGWNVGDLDTALGAGSLTTIMDTLKSRGGIS